MLIKLFRLSISEEWNQQKISMKLNSKLAASFLSNFCVSGTCFFNKSCFNTCVCINVTYISRKICLQLIFSISIDQQGLVKKWLKEMKIFRFQELFTLFMTFFGFQTDPVSAWSWLPKFGNLVGSRLRHNFLWECRIYSLKIC